VVREAPAAGRHRTAGRGASSPWSDPNTPRRRPPAGRGPGRPA